MTSLFPPFNRRSSFRKQPYFYEAGRGVNYKSTGGPFPTLDLNFLSGTLDPRITFSRASNATLTDSTGKITYAPANLTLQSQTFDNASWVKTATTASADATTAPDGTTTADRIAEDATTASHNIQQSASFTAGVAYTMSVYVKKGSGATAPDIIQSTFNAGAFGTQYANFNISTGVVTASTGGTAAITAAGSGWYRISWTATCTTTGAGFILPISFCNNNPTSTRAPSYAGATTSDIFVWGAQLEAVTYQTTPSTYNATTTAAYYGPRFDYDPATLSAKGLLIEEARTNSLLQSENFAASWSLLRMTVSADATTSPSGTTTADQLLDTAVAGTHVAIQTITKAASSLAYTASVYLKANVRTLGELRMSDQSGNGVRNTFNLSAGTIGSPSTFGTGFAATGSTITNVGNGWYRVDVSCTTNTATTLGHEVYIADASGNTSYTGNGSGFYAWGAQLEAGAFATSYIPTVASSVARSADIATMTGTNFSSWFNQGVGTFVTKADAYSVTAYGPLVVARNSATALQNRLDLSTNAGVATQTSRFTVTVSNVTQADTVVVGPTIAPNTAYTFAGAFATNDFISASQGSLSSADTSGAVPTVDILEIGNRSGTLQLNGHLQYIKYYPTRLPNTQLVSLTQPSLTPSMQLVFDTSSTSFTDANWSP